MIVRPILDHRAFELVQPRTHRQFMLGKSVLPDVDMRALLEREGKTRSAMLQHRRSDAERGLAMDDARGQRPATERFVGERVFQSQSRGGRHGRSVNFGDHKDKIEKIPVNEIPLVSLKLMTHSIDKPMRSV